MSKTNTLKNQPFDLSVSRNIVNLLDLYQKKDFQKLSQSNLRQPIDNDGNTIIHVMAENLDKVAFELIREINPNAFYYEVINAPNKKQQLPIHLAMISISNNPEMSDEFIDYMINELNANPDIPDGNNMIIVNKKEKENRTSIYNMSGIDELNEKVKSNIEKLTRLAEIKIDDFSKSLKQSKPLKQYNTTLVVETKLNPKTSQKTEENIEFIKNITEYYRDNTQMSDQQEGGYHGKRKIRNYYSDWSDVSENDSFVAKSKFDIMNKISKKNNMFGGNSDSNWRHEEFQPDSDDNIKNNEQKLLRREEKLRNKRLLSGGNKEALRQEEQRIRKELDKINQLKNRDFYNKYTQENNKQKSFMSNWMTEDFNLFTDEKKNTPSPITGGKRAPKNDTKSNIASGKRKTFMDDLKTDDLNLFTSDVKRDSKKSNTRQSIKSDDGSSNESSDVARVSRKSSNRKLNRSDNSSSIESTNVARVSKKKPVKVNFYRSDDNDDDIFDDNTSYEDEFWENQDRPRQPRDEKVDEIYRSFLKKIIELLGVDEETAKFYRSAIKINLENSNPELKKRVNDALKVKEMEPLFESKSKLKAVLDKIDMNQIKKQMSEKKEEGERRRAEAQKRREEKQKNFSGKKTNNTTSSSEKTTTSNSMTTSTEPPKTKGRAKKAKVSENGYLKSDEIIFSSEY